MQQQQQHGSSLTAITRVLTTESPFCLMILLSTYSWRQEKCRQSGGRRERFEVLLCRTRADSSGSPATAAAWLPYGPRQQHQAMPQHKVVYIHE